MQKKFDNFYNFTGNEKESAIDTTLYELNHLHWADKTLGCSPVCCRSSAVGMAPSCSPEGRGFSCSGVGNSGRTLLWVSTAFLNWVYTSGNLTTTMKCFKSLLTHKSMDVLSLASGVSSHRDVWWNGRSSLWYSVNPQQVWTLTFICAQTSFTFFSTFSSSEVTWNTIAWWVGYVKITGQCNKAVIINTIKRRGCLKLPLRGKPQCWQSPVV